MTDVDRLKEGAFLIQHIIPCEYVLIDFGANIGDSSTPGTGSPKTYNLRPRLDVKTGSVGKDCYNCKNLTTMTRETTWMSGIFPVTSGRPRILVITTQNLITFTNQKWREQRHISDLRPPTTETEIGCLPIGITYQCTT